MLTFSQQPNMTSRRGTCRMAWNLGNAQLRLEPEIHKNNVKHRFNVYNPSKIDLPDRWGNVSFKDAWSFSPSRATWIILDSVCLRCLAKKYQATNCSKTTAYLEHGSSNPSGNASTRWGFLRRRSASSSSSGSIRFWMANGKACKNQNQIQNRFAIQKKCTYYHHKLVVLASLDA